MALQSSGPISLLNVQTEFGGSNPINFSEYYAGVGLVPSGTVGLYGPIPSSSTIRLQQFYGVSAAVPNWLNITGSAQWDIGLALSVDASNNIYITGRSDVGTTFANYCTAKYNASGIIQWQRLLGGTNYDQVYDLVLANNNIYVLGDLIGVDGPMANSNDFLLAAYSTTGVLQWQQSLGGADGRINRGLALAADITGNLFAVGSAYSESAINTSDALTVKYNASGVLQWQRAIYGVDNGQEQAVQVVIGASNDIYVGLQVEPRDNIMRGGYIAKYNTSGVLQWQRKFADPFSNIMLRSMAIDSSENIYGVGYQSVSPYNGSSRHAFFIKYNASGVLQWQRKLTASVYAEGGVVIVNGSDVYFSVNTLVSGTTAPSDPDRAVILKYNASGVLQWQRLLSHSTGTIGLGEFKIVSGEMYMTGSVRMTPTGDFDMFLLKLPADGSKLGTYSVPTINYSGTHVITYSVSTVMTDAPGTLPEAAGTLAEASRTLTTRVRNVIDSAGSLTSITVNI